MTNKAIFAISFTITVLLLAFAYYLEYWHSVMPCALCLLQRFSFYMLSIVFLVGFVAPYKKWSHYSYGILTILFSVIGIAIASRQLYLQHLPASQDPGCVADLTYLLQTFPLTQALEQIFQGSPECAISQWSFLTLDMAGWACIWFLIFVIVGLYTMLRQSK